ncbi:MAG TPA: UDP-2,3-diacylglucosamine diphosphatase [Gammaproteobacteria bacterium]|nr:UDP-2,3-diacylglucosamine diphosphatase [Gammaproteobacteria bacterium]
MSSLFNSDLHLDAARPAITALFLEFLAGEARAAETLYILGDLFEAWIGDDDPDPHHAEVAAALASLTAAGVPVRFLVGNRDFLLGENYAARAGMEILCEPVTLNLHGRPTVVLHGDVLCTDDRDYQEFRATVRNPGWQRAFLARPVAERRAAATAARAESRRRLAGKAPEIMDVNEAAVAAMFREQAVTRMIHGHTHRPAMHRLEVDGRSCERIVLGDWYEQGSVLHVDDAGIELKSLALS